MQSFLSKIKGALLLGLAFMLLTGFFGSAIPAIDTHEHIESLKRAKELKASMKSRGISQTVLLPSPIETITLNGNSTFTQYQANVAEILRIARVFPEEFIPFCTVSPLDSDALEIFKNCVAGGGKGLKLYNGHSFYYGTFAQALDSPAMMPIYEFAEAEGLPIIYHVNIAKYGDELERVLNAFPNLRVSVPHFMVASADLPRAADLMSRYPNLYTDVSFGSEPFLAAGFRRISENADKFRDFIERFSDRILWGTDMVLTNIEKKDASYMKRMLKCYQDMLGKAKFICKPVAEYYKAGARQAKKQYEACTPLEGDFCAKTLKKFTQFDGWAKETRRLNGLDLPRETLEKVYQKNPQRFLFAF